MGGLFGGGGGGVDIPSFGDVLNSALGGFGGVNKKYKNFWKKDPLLSTMRDFTQNQAYPNLSELFGNLPPASQLTDPLQALLGGLPNISQLTNPLANVSGSLQSTFQNLPGVSQLTQPLGQLTGQLQGRMKGLMNVAPTLAKTFQTQIAPVLTSGGRLTREQQLEADRASNAASALAGMATSNQGLAANLLNRDVYRRQRFAEAQQGAGALQGVQAQDVGSRLGLTQGITGLQQAIQGLRSSDIANRLGLGQGIQGLQQGIQGLRTSDIANRLGLSQGIQGIRGQDINQRMGLAQGINQLLGQPGNTAVGQFSTLMNPLYGLAGNWLNAQASAQGAAAGAEGNKKGGTMEGIGSIVGAVLPLLMMSEDDMKANVKDLGTKTPMGIPEKEFTYRGDKAKRRFHGVMASDVEKIMPSAVIRLPVSGHRLVDFSQIDAPFYEIKT